MQETKMPTDPEDEKPRPNDQDEMEEAQEDAAEEREEEGGYQ